MPEPLRIVVDTREQRALSFECWPDIEVVGAKLEAGDYSIVGYEDRFTLERKSISDLVGSLTSGRDRFRREMERLSDYEFKAVLVEGAMLTVAAGRYRSKASPESILGSLNSWWVRYGVPTIWCGDPALAARTVRNLAYHYVKQATQNEGSK